MSAWFNLDCDSPDNAENERSDMLHCKIENVQFYNTAIFEVRRGPV